MALIFNIVDKHEHLEFGGFDFTQELPKTTYFSFQMIK